MGRLGNIKHSNLFCAFDDINDYLIAEHVYCTETRPYNQGARLTAFELVHDKLPATLILDSMVAALFRTRKIAAVVVGADRVIMKLFKDEILKIYFLNNCIKMDFRWLQTVTQLIKLVLIK